MCAFDQAEQERLSIMFKGDADRDASSSIRGFLFQDYIAVMALTKDEVDAVCSEYLEDVNVISRNTLALIQAKHYPNTNFSMKPVATDLYYQYLRLKMLKSTSIPAPRLCIHGKIQIPKPSLADMKTYINLGNQLQTTATYPDPADVNDWLEEHVNYKIVDGEKKKQKKDEQKKSLFASMAAEDSLKDFLNVFEVINLDNIGAYKSILMDELSKTYLNPDPDGDEEHWKSILLGLAVMFIQRSYLKESPNSNKLWVTKKEFKQHMEEFTQINTTQTIISYLAGVAYQVYGNIVDNNTLNDLQTVMLNQICLNTIQWLEEIGKTKEGQYKLLNTLSKKTVVKFADFDKKIVRARLDALLKCDDSFTNFLAFLWKIMLNICQEELQKQGHLNTLDESQKLEWIQKHSKLFDPKRYIDPTIKDYVCLHFPKDHATHSIILPSGGGQPQSTMLQIITRITTMEQGVPKPDKWFFQNHANGQTIRGHQDYNVHMASIKVPHSVATLDEPGFYIECMNCINIEWNSWSKPDPCGDCIFRVDCHEGGT